MIGVLEPNDFDKIFEIPASSTTARTGPPAITPVPAGAGFKNTLPAPQTPVIWWGIVVSMIGTLIKFFLASSTALLIASGTSIAFPVPRPTRPFLSPTTTTALKRYLRPPFTTFVTWLMLTTRSSNSFSTTAYSFLFWFNY